MIRILAPLFVTSIATVSLTLAPKAAASAPLSEGLLLASTTYTPVELVDAAYSGRLDGISRFGALESDIAEGNVTAEEVVRAGIEAGYATEANLSDRGFIRNVDAALRNIVGDDN